LLSTNRIGGAAAGTHRGGLGGSAPAANPYRAANDVGDRPP